MIENLFGWLTNSLSQNFWLAISSSFIWGILSIVLSPCHLTSIPLIIGYLSSQGNISLKNTFILSLIFATGILITISLIGVITLSLGRLMGDIGTIGNLLIACVFFIVGLYLADIIKLPSNGLHIKGTQFKGLWGALILGLIFGVALGPCTFSFMAPILGIIFQASSSHLSLSISILAMFSLGHISVIVFAGTLIKKIQQYLHWTENSKSIKYLKRGCGILVMLGGVYLISNTI